MTSCLENIKRKTPLQAVTRSKQIYRIGRCLKFCGTVHFHQAQECVDSYKLQNIGCPSFIPCYFLIRTKTLHSISVVERRHKFYKSNTVKSFYFVRAKFRGLMMMDMFEDTWTRGFWNLTHNFKLNQHFVVILNSWIVIPMKYTKGNV